LDSNWEADHIIRYSDGGTTTVTNAQALCKSCHLSKTKLENQLDYAFRPTNTGKEPRKWQKEALTAIEQKRQADPNNTSFAVNATPGAGKSLFMQLVVRHFLHIGLIDTVLCVVPTDSLRGDLAAGFTTEVGIKLVSAAGPLQVREVKDAVGQVVTYQQLANPESLDTCLDHWTRNGKKLFVIADEIHHAAEHAESSWGQCLQQALDKSSFHLLLTGTMWRSDQAKIPGIKYISSSEQELLASPDYNLSLEQATKEGYVTTVWFDKNNIEVQFTPSASEAKAFSETGDIITKAIKDSDGKAADILLRAIVENPQLDGVKALLADAHKSLLHLKQRHLKTYNRHENKDVPPAPAGLVVAKTKKHADQIASILYQITGDRPVIVHGSVPENCKDRIRAFRTSRKDWIVSVGMISEGVDIPRIKVIAYLTNKKTRLIFAQIVGRAQRVRYDHLGQPVEEQAKVYIPAHYELTQYATEFLEAQNAIAKEDNLFQKEEKKEVDKELAELLEQIKEETQKVKELDADNVLSTTFVGRETTVNGEEVAGDLFFQLLADYGVSMTTAEAVHIRASKLGLLTK
jgi:superfamily II DNA or RNA helicase